MTRPSPPWTSHPTLEELIAVRLSRRSLLKGLAAGVAGAVVPGLARGAQPSSPSPGPSSLTFTEIAHGLDDRHHVPPGYASQVVVAWGDPLFADAPPFVPGRPDAADQSRRFGYDNDFTAFLPLPRGSQNSANGLLCVNHERCTTRLMWPGMEGDDWRSRLTAEHCAHEMAAQGHSIVEVRREGRTWKTVPASRYNRRIDARSTRMRIAGPAAGHPRMQTSEDPAGRLVTGTFNNCAGGVTPWGTVLTCEENFHYYFLGDPAKTGQAESLRRYRVDGRSTFYEWGRFFDRFHLEREPNEPNRFGWVVEIDPFDPIATPVKRTALGRCKHEGAATVLSHDGRAVVYMGDDERFEYLYKFVSRDRYDPAKPESGRNLLDHGTLHVARFDAGGRVEWLPLVHGVGPLTVANGFADQGEVVIDARRAADLLGATPMDRPEDIEPHPFSGRVYVALTNNTRRKPDQVDAANPRGPNPWGHVVELVPPLAQGAADHTATTCTWEFFLLAGNPADPTHSARYLGPVSANGWLACPDNFAFDPRGRVWIATDGQDEVAGMADSLYAADTDGPGRGITRLFFNGPRGAEICGPSFTPDGRTVFVPVQHPGDEKGSTFEQPSTRWPDFRPDMPPRPAVLAIQREDGAEIGR